MKEFAVSGVLQFDKRRANSFATVYRFRRQVCAEFLKVGIDISNLTYVRPGESIEGAINLDTAINSAWFTMNQLIPPISTTTPKEQKEVTSTAEIVYKTMVELGKLENPELMDRLVDL